ncbi:MAG TPA: helix-turn-helix transcriptional regulator [Pseudonocardia sp.]|nr:helix-turn-helix transcriptional regulator [Pseudonocardia sp.]
MDSAEGSTLARRQLGRRLRRVREAAGKSIEDVVFAGVVSRTKLWRIEHGRTAVKTGDVLALTRLYGTEPTEVDALVPLVEATKSSGLIEDYGAAVPQGLGLYAELEATASAVHDYSSELIHGLLQTPDYARAVIESDRSLTPEVVEQRVAFRMERQRRFFDRAEPGRLETVVTAGAMNLVVGSAAVMEEQIAHLRAVHDKGAARIGVLPATDGVHRAMRGPFVVLDFDDPEDPDVAYVENLAGSRYLDKPTDVAQFREAFEEVRDRALSLEEWLR